MNSKLMFLNPINIEKIKAFALKQMNMNLYKTTTYYVTKTHNERYTQHVRNTGHK